METIQKLLDLLSPSERKRAGVLMGMILVMAFLDMLGVASILPFIAVLANPSLVENNRILSWGYEFSANLGVSSIEQFLFLLGLLVFILLIFSLIFKALTTYAQIRFALMREYSIGKRIIEGYLHQPYSWFLNRHSADLGKNILSEVSSVIYGGMIPLMTLMAQITVAIVLLALLIFIDSILTISVVIALGLAYGGIVILMSGWVKELGYSRIHANKERYTVVSEAFGAIKEVKTRGLEDAFILKFTQPAKIYAKGQAESQVASLLPRFVLEAIAFGGMLLVVLYLMSESGDLAVALPVIALYAFAGYRLMPALQQIYGAIIQLKYAAPLLNELHADLMSLDPIKPQEEVQAPLTLKKVLELKNIFFHYPNASLPALNGIDLIIPSCSTVGLIGSTGSGKTTTVDLILGLLEPQKGEFCVDGKVINANNRRQWQKNVGYVPQQVYLADDTISANIAFGVNPEEIDQKAVEHAAKIANIHEFIIQELPQGYSTSIGERGIRLSGGQRQRIGIARALYHLPQVLILDEATSALDNITERAVMDAVQNLGRSVTIIIIAHRLTTVRECDQIFFFDNGVIREKGNFDDLVRVSNQFRSMLAKN